MAETGKFSDVALHTTIVRSTRIGDLASFYARGLQLGEPQPTGPDHLGMPLANAYLGFDLVEVQPDPSGAVSLWFEVGDLEESFEHFKQLGAGVRYPPTDQPWGARLASLYDPDGNAFGLTQRSGGEAQDLDETLPVQARNTEPGTRPDKTVD